MPFLPDGTPLDIILNPIGVPSRMNLGQVLETHLGLAAETLGFHARTPVFDGAPDTVIEDQLARAWIVQASGAVSPRDLEHKYIDWDRVDEWLGERGYERERVWSDAVSNRGTAREACLRIWLKEVAGEDVEDLKPQELFNHALGVARDRRLSAPIFGKAVLCDGRSGRPFDQPVTVGEIYMMKLIHLVEDKIHARSTGPYSLITQQPLGGKAQFGGQRFGEMEVWALEAYSAAYTLQEMLTIKSDDVVGRVKTYEAIVKGEEVIQPGVPESFHVLLKELQGLGLSVELLNQDADQFATPEDSDGISALLGAPLSWDDFSEGAALELDEPADFAEELEDEESGLSDDAGWRGRDGDDSDGDDDEEEDESESDSEPDEASLAMIDESDGETGLSDGDSDDGDED
jgi:DNA-directed RNA polymerase subunit beta